MSTATTITTFASLKAQIYAAHQSDHFGYKTDLQNLASKLTSKTDETIKEKYKQIWNSDMEQDLRDFANNYQFDKDGTQFIGDIIKRATGISTLEETAKGLYNFATSIADAVTNYQDTWSFTKTIFKSILNLFNSVIDAIIPTWMQQLCGEILTLGHYPNEGITNYLANKIQTETDTPTNPTSNTPLDNLQGNDPPDIPL